MTDPYVTISEVCADGTGAVTHHPLSPVKAAHARSDREEDDKHHDLYLKRKENGEL